MRQSSTKQDPLASISISHSEFEIFVARLIRGCFVQLGEVISAQYQHRKKKVRRRRLSPTVRATKLSFFQPRVSRYTLYELVCTTIGPRRALVFPIPRRKNRQLLAGLPPREEVTTNYSGERDSDEMKRSDLAPFSLFLHSLPICPQPLSALYTLFFRGANLADVTT